MSKNIKLVKLISGEEILCNLEQDNINSIHISETLLIGLQQDPQSGKVGPGVMPFCPFAVEALVIDKSKVTFITEPAEPIKNIHNKTFSAVITPPTGIITARDKKTATIAP